MPILSIKEKFQKTKDFIKNSLGKILFSEGKLDDEVLEEIEAVLLQADMGVDVVEAIIFEIKKRKVLKKEVYGEVKKIICEILDKQLEDSGIIKNENGPTIILVLGVNGAGKTTSIAKLANKLMDNGGRVLLAAADTFRAGAIEQIDIWAKKIGVDTVKHVYGADPSAVCYDAVNAAIGRKIDYLIIDTAGRFHNRLELVEELKKMKRTINKCFPGAPHEKLLVVDANCGQNGLAQAKQFNEAVGLTGIIVAKLDGTAKGGVLVGIQKELGVPVKYIGLGQGLEDIEKFDAKVYIDAIM